MEYVSALCKKLRSNEISKEAFEFAQAKFNYDSINMFQVVPFYLASGMLYEDTISEYDPRLLHDNRRRPADPVLAHPYGKIGICVNACYKLTK